MRWSERNSETLAIAQRLSDARLRRLVKRIFLFERPELLTEVQRVKWTAELERRICVDEEKPWLTIPAALREISAMKLEAGIVPMAIEQLGDLLTARLQRFG
jgi:hypothetical protein